MFTAIKKNVEELESKAFDYNSDDTYILNVSVNGSHVECYVNGTKYIDIDTVYAVQGERQQLRLLYQRHLATLMSM